MSLVLLTEDDRMLRGTLGASLRAWNFDVLEAASGEEALTMVAGDRPDLVILDLGLPGIDGFETLRHLRSFTYAPVVVLSVRDTLRDKVAALDAGADDFVVKPFEPDELHARLRAQLRRVRTDDPPPPLLHYGPLEIDLARASVTLDGEGVTLTPTEFRMLDVLIGHRGRLVTHAALLESVWRTRPASALPRVRTFVQQLRRKLGDDGARPRLILTEVGLGYRWIGDDEDLD
jgi:two-component system KDP operon response regulator KdpE